MNPSELIPGKKYIYRPNGSTPIELEYRHETINYYMFDVVGEVRLMLLHFQQVKHNLECKTIN